MGVVKNNPLGGPNDTTPAPMGSVHPFGTRTHINVPERRFLLANAVTYPVLTDKRRVHHLTPTQVGVSPFLTARHPL